ncbi:hypothetical protein O3M35_006666 [Rhynocoris fuscipes]|uniref:Uncharacterized protein n=1 Tax=Rhynocoris fuscipes TaxID=488301 RepID=A0AAW1DLZ1_9HEMI
MTNEKLTAKFQRKHSCCGVNSVNDWNSIIPASCCKSNVLKCEREKAFTKGCKDQLIYETRLWIISTVHYEAPLPKSAGISRLSRYTTRLLSIDLDTGNVGNTSEGGKSFFARFRSNPT